MTRSEGGKPQTKYVAPGTSTNRPSRRRSIAAQPKPPAPERPIAATRPTSPACPRAPLRVEQPQRQHLTSRLRRAASSARLGSPQLSSAQPARAGLPLPPALAPLLAPRQSFAAGGKVPTSPCLPATRRARHLPAARAAALTRRYSPEGGSGVNISPSPPPAAAQTLPAHLSPVTARASGTRRLAWRGDEGTVPPSRAAAAAAGSRRCRAGTIERAAGQETSDDRAEAR
ncbi:uncharacterized protein LOC136015939 [Lathamus discolor]|uniref:uncharacterized protein LOC136015939 n=1 Tax=Lathamus discolor TaxID=678569 RepID=UPI0032B7AD6E